MFYIVVYKNAVNGARSVKSIKTQTISSALNVAREQCPCGWFVDELY